MPIDHYHLGCPFGDSRERGQLTYRAAAEYRDRLTWLQAGHLDGMPPGGEDVGKHDIVVLLVSGTLGQPEAVEVSPRDAQELRLSARPRTHVREAVGSPCDAWLVGPQPVVGQTALAVLAVTAGDVERGGYHVAALHLLAGISDLELLPEAL